jgi:NADH-quinone oxidoreductase subunit C
MIEQLKQQFSLSEINQPKENLTFFTVDKDQVEMVLITLRDHYGYKHLSFIAGIDLIEQNLFKFTYMVYNYDKKHSYGVHCYIDRENPVMHSLHHLWEQVGTYQRELHEMLGIDFPGSPRLEENLSLDEGWDGPPPMRRDFDTKEYSENTFFQREGRVTYDPREYMREKLYPDFPKEESDRLLKGGNK